MKTNRPAVEELKKVAANCPGFQSRATARAVTNYFNACFKALDLTSEQFSLMVGIGSQEGITLIVLAANAGIDPTTLSRNLVSLELRKLVSAEGGRGRLGKQLSLTKEGSKLLAKALPIWVKANSELAARTGRLALRSVTRQMADLAAVAKALRR